MAQNNKHFWFKFYTNNWVGDLSLQLCSLKTQGAWIRLLCWMHKAQPRCGYLTDENGIPIDELGRKRLLQLEHNQEEYEEIWSELTKHNIIRLDTDGVWYSKRLAEENGYVTKTIEQKFDKKILESAKEVINYFNSVTKKNFRNDDENNIVLIATKLTKNFTVDDFKKVVNIKYEEWKDQEIMSAYLRPSTFFGEKFESYINQVQTSVVPDKEINKRGYDPKLIHGVTGSVEKPRIKYDPNLK